MPKRTLLFTVAILVLISAVLLWFRSYSQSSGRTQPRSADAIPDHAKTSSVLPLSQDDDNAPNAYTQSSVPAESVEAATDAYIENIRRDPEYQWKRPINFFGKVVDQNDDPVEGAAVRFQWVNLQGSEGVEEADTTTDAEGRFSLRDKNGKNLGVNISKEGYHDASPYDNQLNFEYANPAERTFYEPNASNPVTFRLRKKGKSEKLITNEVKFDLPGQGAMATVDLLTGHVLPKGGQLEITVWKPTIANEQINTGKVFPYDWRVQIKINDGGLAEHTDAFPFEAPESGYLAQFDASLHPRNSASRDVTVDQQFYFYFDQPRKYGRMRFRTDGHRSRIAINYWLNPSGSRNLEYDASEEDL